MNLRINAIQLSTILGCAKSTATKLIAQMNQELKEQGYLTIRGSVPKKYAYQRLRIEIQEKIEEAINGKSN